MRNPPTPRLADGRARRASLALALLAATVGCSDAALDATINGGRSPNVLVYMVDTLRADALSPYGNEVLQTPEIARFAEGAIVYEQAFAASSWTRASVASLFSGLQPDVHNVRDRADRASEPVAALASAFRDAGYRTGAIVTNPNVGRFFGFGEGFDDYIELFEHSDDPVVIDEYAPRARADEVTKRAIRWIDEGDAPWFLFVLVTDPHAPYAPPPGFDTYSLDDARRSSHAPLTKRGRKRRGPRIDAHRRYMGEVTFTDRAFGALMQHLRRRELDDDTIVALTADHGEHFGDHDALGHGRTLFQAVLHIPLILRLPGGERGGHRLATPVQLVDLHPTLVSMAGVALPVAAARPGDASPLPLEERANPRPAFAQLDLDTVRAEMIYAAPWKYIRPPPYLEPAWAPTRTVLYDLTQDPEERQNEAEAKQVIASQLEELLDLRAEGSGVLSAAVVTSAPPEVMDMPDDVQRALEHLGYIEPASTEAAPNARPSESKDQAGATP